jgi:CBS domain-containing protein
MGSIWFIAMRAKDLMSTEVVTIREDDPVARLCDVLQAVHANGLPVLNAHGELVGVVTEDDVLYGTMGAFDKNGTAVLVRDIMTAPAVCATEDTDVVELSRMMWGMRIHRIPIVLEGRVTGVVTALDVVRAVAQGLLSP